MGTTLYGLAPSHPSHAARLMLERKGIEHRVVNLVAGTHTALLRPLGFRRGTVPALRMDGRRVQGSRQISRALEEAQPEPRLSPPIRSVESGSRRPSAGGTTSSSTPLGA